MRRIAIEIPNGNIERLAAAYVAEFGKAAGVDESSNPAQKLRLIEQSIKTQIKQFVKDFERNSLLRTLRDQEEAETQRIKDETDNLL